MGSLLGLSSQTSRSCHLCARIVFPIPVVLYILEPACTEGLDAPLGADAFSDIDAYVAAHLVCPCNSPTALLTSLVPSDLFPKRRTFKVWFYVSDKTNEDQRKWR